MQDFCQNNTGFQKLDTISPLVSYNAELADKLCVMLCNEDW